MDIIRNLKGGVMASKKFIVKGEFYPLVVRLIVLLVIIVLLHFIFLQIPILRKPLSQTSLVSTMMLIDALLSIATIIIVFSFKQNFCNQLLIRFSEFPEIAKIASNLVLLFLIIFAFISFYPFAFIAFRSEYIWVYDLFLLAILYPIASIIETTSLVLVRRRRQSR